ncbi:hypothetical protein AM593_04631, partial [Mytilus galloprovincialis]
MATKKQKQYMSFEEVTPTAKHISFVCRSMQGIGVEKVPGIGTMTKTRLARKGISYAQQLFGQCLVRDLDRKKCKTFFQSFGMNDGLQTDAFNAFKEWADQHL